jgi:deoxyribodipyrimidine photo-lyase
MQKQTAKKAFKSAVFIFRRDLRLDDNTGLLKALKLAEKVYPVFIFDPRQIDKARNDYFSNTCVQFMCDSLADLDLRLKERGSQLNYLHGEYPDVIEDVIKATKADLLAVNMDYTKFSKKRDQQIRSTCMDNKV